MPLLPEIPSLPELPGPPAVEHADNSDEAGPGPEPEAEAVTDAELPAGDRPASPYARRPTKKVGKHVARVLDLADKTGHELHDGSDFKDDTAQRTVMEGNLEKAHGGVFSPNWHARYFSLRASSLSYFAKRGDPIRGEDMMPVACLLTLTPSQGPTCSGLLTRHSDL